MLITHSLYLYIMILSRFFLSILFVAVIGCTKSGVDEEQDASSGGGNAPVADGSTLLCGVVDGGRVVNSVDSISGPLVVLSQVISPSLIGVRLVGVPGSGDLLIKLQGVADRDATREGAIRLLGRLIGRQATLVRPGESCPVIAPGGGRGELGALITSDGSSVSEVLIASGLVNVAQADGCSGALLTGCLNSLLGVDQVTAGELESFLWKPISESDGKLAIHTGPFGTNVVVNGELGTNKGPGNGFGSLARFRQVGCAYGRASIQVTDARTGVPYTFQGQTSFSILDPCQRNCIEGGRMVFCPK